MKCPSCQFVSSDLRDICPKCLHDLRAEKKASGIAVTNPDASYQELVQKLVGSGSKKDEEPKKEGFFARIFKKSPRKDQAVKSKIDTPQQNHSQNVISQETSEDKIKHLFDSKEEQDTSINSKSSMEIQDKFLDVLETEYPPIEINSSLEEDLNSEDSLASESDLEEPQLSESSITSEVSDLELSNEIFDSNYDNKVSEAVTFADSEETLAKDGINIDYDESIQTETNNDELNEGSTEIIELPEVSSNIDELVAQALGQVEDEQINDIISEDLIEKIGNEELNQEDYNNEIADEYTNVSRQAEYADITGGVNLANNSIEDQTQWQAYSGLNDQEVTQTSLQEIVNDLVKEELGEEALHDQFQVSYFEEVPDFNSTENTEIDSQSEIVEDNVSSSNQDMIADTNGYFIENLFDKALNDISLLKAGVDYDIALPPTIAASKDEVEVLFSLSKQSLESPESLNKLEEKVDLSSSREIETADLDKTLKITEKAIEMPALSLKELQKEEAIRIRGTLAKDKDSHHKIYGRRAKSSGPVQADLWKRFTATILDTLVTSAISLAIVILLCFTITPELSDKLWNMGSYEFYEVLPLYGLISAAFLITYFSYPILALLFAQNTLGMYLVGIRLRTNDLKKLRFGHLFVRSFSRPVSLLFLGFLPPLFGKKSLPDYLAQTVVIS